MQDAREPVSTVELLLDLKRGGNRFWNSGADLAVELVPPSDWSHSGVGKGLAFHDGIARGKDIIDEDGAGHGQWSSVAFDWLNQN